MAEGGTDGAKERDITGELVVATPTLNKQQSPLQKYPTTTVLNHFQR